MYILICNPNYDNHILFYFRIVTLHFYKIYLQSTLSTFLIILFLLFNEFIII